MRALHTLAHLLLSLVALGLQLPRRKRALLVFTHEKDVDRDGWDRQMGAVLTTLRAAGHPCIELVLVPLGSLLRCLRRKGRPILSLAALFGPARFLAFGNPERRDRLRIRFALAVLRILRPRAVVLVDESGSGQPLVRAARKLGIPSIGIQHGDFVATNPQYAPQGELPFDRVPVDRLCVWSPWFRDRLLAISPIYDDARIRVTGRARGPVEPRDPVPGRVLILGENDPAFHRALDVFLADRERYPELTLRLRPHPAESAEAELPPLHEELQEADCVLALRSSAVLEALHYRRPVALPMTPLGDPAAFVEAGIAIPCRSLDDLVKLVQDAGRKEGQRGAFARVWGQTPADPEAAILQAIEDFFSDEECGR